MHEVGIVQSVLELAEQQAGLAHATCIYALQMRVGQLTGIVPEALEHAFAVLRTDTMAAQAQLRVEYVPASAWCQNCVMEFEAPGMYCECPNCGASSLDIRHGLEIELVSLEVE